jgi:acyl carrier protein
MGAILHDHAMGDVGTTTIAATVRTVLAEGLGVDETCLTPETDLYDELAADSIAVMEVLCTLEDQLGIELPESNCFAMKLRTVGDVVEAFRSRAGQSTA